MLHEIVNARKTLTVHISESPVCVPACASHTDRRRTGRKDRTPYNFKRHAIHESLYGVDIDSSAVDIAKLRLWLSLVVDEDDFKTIKPLPNLDYKIVCGNSLLKVEKDLFNEKLFKELEALKQKFFDETNVRKKEEEKKKIDALIKQITNNDEHFDFEVYFSEVFHSKGGFDVLIANPPYLRIQQIKKNDPDLAIKLKENYFSASGNYDIYVCFVELSINLMNDGGNVAYILPHKFFQTSFGKNLRKLISSKQLLKKIVSFGSDQVFDSATTYTCLLFLDNSAVKEVEYSKIKDLQTWQEYIMTGLNISKKEVILSGKIPISSVTSDSWNFVVGKEGKFFEKLSEIPLKLGDVADVFVGLQTSADDVFIMDFIEENKNDFRFKSKTLNKECILEKALFFPIVSGMDVKRYTKLSERQYILFPYDLKDGSAKLIDFNIITDKYPKTATFLLNNKTKLENRERGKFRGTEWHRFGRNQNIGIQSRIKLCIPRLVENLYATYDVDGTHFLDNVDVNGITIKEQFKQYDLCYLLGLLNSNVLHWFFSNISVPFRGGWLSANKQFIDPLPIPQIPETEQKSFVSLVDQIVSRKRKNQKADTISLENKINQMAYKLYDLTPEEIKIVDNC